MTTFETCQTREIPFRHFPQDRACLGDLGIVGICRRPTQHRLARRSFDDVRFDTLASISLRTSIQVISLAWLILVLWAYAEDPRSTGWLAEASIDSTYSLSSISLRTSIQVKYLSCLVYLGIVGICRRPTEDRLARRSSERSNASRSLSLRNHFEIAR